MVFHKALGIDIAALICQIRDTERAEKQHDRTYAQQKKRCDLDPELGLYLFHLESASIL